MTEDKQSRPEIYLGFAELYELDPRLDYPDGCNGKIGGKPVCLEDDHVVFIRH